MSKVLGKFTAQGDQFATGINANVQPGVMVLSNAGLKFPGSVNVNALHVGIDTAKTVVQDTTVIFTSVEYKVPTGTARAVVEGTAGTPGSGGFRIIDNHGTVLLERGPQAFDPGSGEVIVAA